MSIPTSFDLKEQSQDEPIDGKTEKVDGGIDNQGATRFEISENVICALAYTFFVIPLLLLPNSSKAKFHANQGLWLVIISFILMANIIYFVNTYPFMDFEEKSFLDFIKVNLSFFNLIWGYFVLCIFLIALLFSVTVFTYWILGIYYALKGEMKWLPGFSKLPRLVK